MDLAEVVLESGATSVAVVGTAKNVGKTVTMNYLSAEISSRGMVLGLASSGRDGEAVDAFTGEPKPAVIPPPGSLIATAEGTLGQGGTLLEILDVGERPGLLGRLVIGRVVEPYPFELVGPNSVWELAWVVRRLKELGAGIVLVDGALDRVAAASPQVSGAAVLATGTPCNANLEEMAHQAAFLAWLWDRPCPRDSNVTRLARQAVTAGFVGYVEKARLRLSAHKTSLGYEEEIIEDANEASRVVVPGAVSARLLDLAENLSRRRSSSEAGPLGIIAKDPVSIFAKRQPRVPLEVISPVTLLAITVNPTSHQGPSYEPREVIRAVSSNVEAAVRRRVPVFDVLSGTSWEGVEALAVG